MRQEVLEETIRYELEQQTRRGPLRDTAGVCGEWSNACILCG
jgi:hypothetical protein